ncbi:hypothetical protein Godav_006414 [Gossypium davidsonii]|uniref:RNase H type-1 domain-containing protein n=1 Tax=Gossypium davidsonii TaxID=34287 RepID=A0A7J8S3N7_GOSDV|nr:hypothetical protein [Gossypium davidsonii]
MEAGWWVLKMEIGMTDIFQAAISKIGEVRMIHDWSSNDWKLKFRCILRDINKVVDSIAKEAGGGIGHLIVLIDLPSYLRSLLEENIQHAMHTVTNGA